MKPLLTSAEAAAELGVAPATLYAYVSRGMIRAQPQAGLRQKLYSAEDVRALRDRGAGPPAPFGEAAEVIETGLTAIAGGRLYYRGIPVDELARDARLEAVASLLWQAEEDVFGAVAGFEAVSVADPRAGVITRLIIDLAAASERDPAAFVRTPDAIARTGARILKQMTRTLAGETAGVGPIHRVLAQGWGRPAAEGLVRTALVVLADHELAASTYAVRVATSTGASPWRAITAGLAGLDGSRHGGMGERVMAFLHEVGLPDNADGVFARWLRAGQAIPGFGHPLYEAGDSRCRLLLERVGRDFPRHPALSLGQAVARTGRALLCREPNIDFGLAIACRAAELPPDAPIALFAIARTVGWIGHAIEQAGSPVLIRPRARYVGRAPG
jgi:citrate synthase